MFDLYGKQGEKLLMEDSLLAGGGSGSPWLKEPPPRQRLVRLVERVSTPPHYGPRGAEGVLDPGIPSRYFPKFKPPAKESLSGSTGLGTLCHSHSLIGGPQDHHIT